MVPLAPGRQGNCWTRKTSRLTGVSTARADIALTSNANNTSSGARCPRTCAVADAAVVRPGRENILTCAAVSR